MTNTEKVIRDYKDKHNDKYGLFIEQVNDIKEMSEDLLEVINNAFKYGYMQGRKSAFADIRKAVL